MQAIDKFTVAILGDQSVGKTSLLNRFVIDIFQEKYEPTQGVDYISQTLTVANKPVRLQFFDICGNKQFIFLISNYIKEKSAAIVCYDITRKDENSLKNLPFWIEAIKKTNDNKTLIYIIGNKSDLQKNRKVDLQQAQLTALSFNAQQFEVSAKSNHNIKDAFQVIANDLYHQNLKTIDQQDKEKLCNLQYGQNQTNNFVDRTIFHFSIEFYFYTSVHKKGIDFAIIPIKLINYLQIKISHQSNPQCEQQILIFPILLRFITIFSLRNTFIVGIQIQLVRKYQILLSPFKVALLQLPHIYQTQECLHKLLFEQIKKKSQFLLLR